MVLVTTLNAEGGPSMIGLDASGKEALSAAGDPAKRARAGSLHPARRLLKPAAEIPLAAAPGAVEISLDAKIAVLTALNLDEDTEWPTGLGEFAEAVAKVVDKTLILKAMAADGLESVARIATLKKAKKIETFVLFAEHVATLDDEATDQTAIEFLTTMQDTLAANGGG